MVEHQIHSAINLETPLKGQHWEDGYETDVTPSQEEAPPGYENPGAPNLETHHPEVCYFAGLGDDYHYAM
ncbi:hypothetical protein S83_010666 [Arachis hypogaea]